MSVASPVAFAVAYRHGEAAALLDQPGALAVFDFGPEAKIHPDPRHVRVPLPALRIAPLRECWTVDAPVSAGSDGELRWSAGGGWRLTVVEVTEVRPYAMEAASEHAYRLLLSHVGSCPESRLQRIWNYLGGINQGEGDAERYRLFCSGRARAMAAHDVTHYPAATAIGHRGPHGLLQVYALSSTASGRALENPRQVSAWRYPRQYGPTAPSFARGMCLPDGSLAISGTAAVIGHASHHRNDVTAQADEAFANLRTLLDSARLPAFDAHSPLKIYVRNADDVAAVEAALAQHLDPSVPRVLLRGDICRRELLVEIDGWRFA
ncbi:MAG: pteridine-dependent deoxygenase [Rhodanobacteraceae bacterium]